MDGPGWIAPVVVSAAFLVFMSVRTGLADSFRFLRIVRASKAFTRSEVLLPGQVPEPGTGYDGQFYFALAQDPFLKHGWTVASLDDTLRYRRIVYPFAAWIVSAGRRDLVPYSLVLVNLVALVVLAVVLARWAQGSGRSPWTSLVVTFFPGVWFPLLLDLTEPLHLLLIAIAFTTASTTFILFVATLAKETSAPLMVIDLVDRILKRNWSQAVKGGALLAGYATWVVFVYRLHGARQSSVTGHLLDPPGAPLSQVIHGQPALALLAGAAILVCLLAIARLRVTRDPAAIASAVYAAIVLAAGQDTWVDPNAYLRVMAGVLVLLFISWCGRHDAEGSTAIGLSGMIGGVATVQLAVLTLHQ